MSKKQFERDLEWFMAQQYGVGKLTRADYVKLIVDKVKDQVLMDIERGVVPPTVRSFSELHDHVDANGYGYAFNWQGKLPSDEPGDAYIEAQNSLWNTVQNRVDSWLKRRGKQT